MFCPRCGDQTETKNRYCPKCGFDLTAITGGAGAANAGATVPLAAAPPQESEHELIKDALKDEYDLEKELGRGGMAVVYKARDKQLEREVAIKVLPFSLSFDAEFVERFQREARTAGKLEHPNIIPIYRVGKAGRVIYFVMKFIRGKSLSGVIESKGAMPIPDLKRMLLECTRALGYAHKHGIVHRDIKPDNIMFDELGQAIVTDFGIAKAQSGAKLTGTGMSIGTPHYMSPEQARAQNLDGRSDIYSLGVVAYQCLTGHVPFDGEDSFSIGYKHIMEELPVPSLDSPAQREMFPIVQKMMAKKPDERFQSAEELIAALEGATAPSIADIHTEKTVAIEPPKVAKKAAPPVASAATTPLPRASASMGKPKDAERPSTPAAPPPPKPSFKPKSEPADGKKGSKAPLAIAAVLVLVGGGLGAYVFMNKQSEAQRAQFVRDSTLRADSMRLAAARTDSIRRADSLRIADSVAQIAARETSKRETSKRETPRPTPPPAAPPATVAAAQGTISLTGVPRGARIRVDGNVVTTNRPKVAAGTHNIEVTLQGYQTYSNRVTVQANRTVTVPVTMTPATTAAAPPAAPPGAPPAAPPAAGAPAPQCATNPTFALANRNRACYDVRPNPRTTPQLALPSGCPGTTRAATLLVQISPGGEVVGTPAVNRSSTCPSFDQQAVAQVLDMTFTPATKGGTAVAAWTLVQMRPVRQ